TGKWKVRSSPKKWKVLLRGVETEDNLLRYEGNDLAEVFLSQVKCSKFLRLKRTSKRRDKKKDILQVRLGKLNPGEAVIASKQMTDEVKPPANRALREGQRELSYTITKLIKEKLVTIEDDEEALTKLEEQIEAVELWVDWDGKKDMKEDLRAYNSDDDGEDGDEEMKAPAKEDEEMKATSRTPTTRNCPQHWLNKYKVLENAMDAIFEGNDMAAKIEVIVEYLLTRHADDAKDALRKLGVLPKVLDVYEMSATMEECSIGIGTRSEAKAAYVRVSNTRRSTKPQTQNAMKRVKQRFKKGPLKRTLDNEEEERKAKRERRLAAVEG
ncbi:hypothetical protein THAOC_19709, partial [Thalassiosira oceanica]